MTQNQHKDTQNLHKYTSNLHNDTETFLIDTKSSQTSTKIRETTTALLSLLAGDERVKRMNLQDGRDKQHPSPGLHIKHQTWLIHLQQTDGQLFLQNQQMSGEEEEEEATRVGQRFPELKFCGLTFFDDGSHRSLFHLLRDVDPGGDLIIDSHSQL